MHGISNTQMCVRNGQSHAVSAFTLILKRHHNATTISGLKEAGFDPSLIEMRRFLTDPWTLDPDASGDHKRVIDLRWSGSQGQTIKTTFPPALVCHEWRYHWTRWTQFLRGVTYNRAMARGEVYDQKGPVWFLTTVDSSKIEHTAMHIIFMFRTSRIKNSIEHESSHFIG